MDELTQLAIKYGTDKWGKHHYTPVYYDLFKDKRNDIKSLLEIGIAEGAGLRMFRDFFPKAQIYGADIDIKRVKLTDGEERIRSFPFDQSSIDNIKDIVELIPQFDIVIDDGSHELADQVFTCLGMMQFLKKDVIYIIEDVANENWKILMKLLEKYQIQMIKLSERYDDRLLIIKHE